MKSEVHVGIDVSKFTLDVFILEVRSHRRFKNDSNDFPAILQWIEKCSKYQSAFICFEHTGVYSMALAAFLESQHIVFAMVSPLEIKRSMGIVRGKNDVVDSKRIAEYASRFRDKIVVTKLPAKDITRLHFLLTLRDKTARALAGYIAAVNEVQRGIGHEELPELFASYDTIITALKSEIKKIEAAIKYIISTNPDLKTSFKLITSLKGVSLIVGTYMIVYTCNFTKFATWRKFACYCGIAPFGHQSGVSVKGPAQVSPIANKQLKRLLHLAAVSAASHDPELREYYIRRQSEGKSKMSTLNIIRNKIVARAFAIVKRGTPYVNIRQYAA